MVVTPAQRTHALPPPLPLWLFVLLPCCFFFLLHICMSHVSACRLGGCHWLGPFGEAQNLRAFPCWALLPYHP